jgi:two-component system response regulator HydG
MQNKFRILIVDDEHPNLESLERILRQESYLIEIESDPKKALERLRKSDIDVLLTDLRMDGMNGVELLQAAKIIDPFIEVVLMTAYGTVEVAVEAIKKGAYDFLTKPIQRLSVLRIVEKAIEKRKLVLENSSLKEFIKEKHNQKNIEILGRSKSLQGLVEIANQASKSNASVLIEGESGTGKGVLAEYLHNGSDRSQGVFVKINCTAIPENLLEAELFGYESGAFTGANKRKKGRVELAHNGTLFLDEIGIAPLTFQTKLLRFLQDGEFERLGSNETLHVNTRVISATNVDLKKAIEQGQLREDLFYRLNVINIKVPPLREREEDIALLAQKFLEDAGKKNNKTPPLLTPEVKLALHHYRWPGNIRELQNLMERLVVLCKGERVELSDLPSEISSYEKRSKILTFPVGISLRQVENTLFDETLRETGGDKKLAAKLLGVHPRTLYRYLESCEQEVPSVEPSSA